jgi:hypothetical protein
MEPQSGRGQRAVVTSEAPGQAAYLVETADVMEATATNLPLLRRRRRAASGGERQSATSLRRSAIVEANGKGSRKRGRRRRRRPCCLPSRDWDVCGGAWWRARGTNKRQRARAISPPQVQVRLGPRLGFSGLSSRHHRCCGHCWTPLGSGWVHIYVSFHVPCGAPSLSRLPFGSLVKLFFSLARGVIFLVSLPLL